MNGEHVRHAPHITISVKNDAQVHNGTHRTVHGYILSTDVEEGPPKIESVAHGPKPDTTRTRSSNMVWPTDLAQLSVVYVDPVDLETLNQEALQQKYEGESKH